MIMYIIESRSAILIPWRHSQPISRLPGHSGPQGLPPPPVFPGPAESLVLPVWRGGPYDRRILRPVLSRPRSLPPLLRRKPRRRPRPRRRPLSGLWRKPRGREAGWLPLTRPSPLTRRSPGRLLVTLCSACHARVHRRLRQRSWLPEALFEFWCEQHPGLPLQLQFTLSPSGDCWEIAV